MLSHPLFSIEINGYKSIKSQKVDLSALNILIGQNGAGKTNFISFFKFLRNIIEGRLERTSLKAGAENLLYYGSKETKAINILLNFSPNYYSLDLEPTNKDSLMITLEKCGFQASGQASTLWDIISSSSNESKLSVNESQIARHVFGELKDWRVYHFHDTSESAGMKKYCSMSDNKFLFEDASNLASFLYIFKATQKDYYERVVKTIQLVIPFFKDFVLEPNPLNNENIRLEWNDKYSDKTFTANELSDGSLRFICMATLLLQKNLPKVILLDEPELGLHPAAITILAGLLQKAATRSQVIVSTQSVGLVNEFEAEDIIVVEHKEAETEFNRLEKDKLNDWLEQYSLGDLWDKNIIGGRP